MKDASSRSRPSTMLLARHAASAANSQRILVGQRMDPSLDAIGMIQAEALGRRLHGTKIDHILVSPMLRARQTLETAIPQISEAEYSVADGLRERDFGTFEGMTRQALSTLRKDNGWGAEDLSNYFPESTGVESLDVVADRAVKSLAVVPQSSSSVLCVTHSGVISALLERLARIPAGRTRPVRVPPASLIVLRRESHNYWLSELWRNPVA